MYSLQNLAELAAYNHERIDHQSEIHVARAFFIMEHEASITLGNSAIFVYYEAATVSVLMQDAEVSRSTVRIR